ncbi:MAG TPA: phage holin family protein [Thermoplasmata archaeon]|nr:phage holin family protein [Thermoplasmata archaeon]
MSSGPPTPPKPTRSLRRQIIVVAGLVATLAGVAVLTVALPSAFTALEASLPYLAAGAVFLWIGGILMGMGFGQKARGRPPPPP